MFPRYCVEKIDYLNLSSSEALFSEIAILDKCFCDIFLHNIGKVFFSNIVEESVENFEEEIRENLPQKNSHTDFYGEYGIAFSKSWGEKNGIQPVWYINSRGTIPQTLQESWKIVMENDDLPIEFSNDLLRRFSYIKPLKGMMTRNNITVSLNKDLHDKEGNSIAEYEVSVMYEKNFHDEQEWRYVPSEESLNEVELDCVVANKNLMIADKGHRSYIDIINKQIENDEKYKCLWLNYDYTDIRYLVVPNSLARKELITAIMNLPSENFILNDIENEDKDEVVQVQKMILASKILVLSDIKGDV